MHKTAELQPRRAGPKDALPTVRTAEALERHGVPEARVRDKVDTQIADVHREQIAACPFALVATRAGDRAVPERSGNHMMGGFHNLIENPDAGLIFFIPGRHETLRIKGTARSTTNGAIFDGGGAVTPSSIAVG